MKSAGHFLTITERERKATEKQEKIIATATTTGPSGLPLELPSAVIACSNVVPPPSIVANIFCRWLPRTGIIGDPHRSSLCSSLTWLVLGIAAIIAKQSKERGQEKGKTNFDSDAVMFHILIAGLQQN